MFAYIKNLINAKPILISYNINMRIKNLWLNLSIYQKMIIGYMLIVSMVVLVSVYIITILFRLNALSSTILSHDITSIDLKKRMINSLLSQDRTKENYLLLGDNIFLDSFNEKKREMISYLAALERLSDAQKEREEIEFFKKIYFEYININKDPIDIESQKIKSRNQIDDMIRAMEAIISYRENIINKKMENAKEIGGNAVRLSIIISIISFMFGITFAFFITKSISEPIERLKHETTNIARGDFNRRIEVASKDEIGGLAAAFNIMCHKLNELERLKSEFVANISHEFRTPLTSLKEANNLMLDGTAGKTTEKQQRLLMIIKEENEKLINMINHLLDLSKMEAGMVKYNFIPSDINMVFENCVNEMRLLAERKDIDLRIEIKENLPIIMMDSEKIKLVMINLLSNALKFTPEGGNVIIRAYKDDSNIRVEVKDTGSGIPQDDINRIFDKFQQVDTAINRKQRGTGLGLSIARHIVDAHKGKIWAESKLGSGSTFTLLLPLRIA
ncbi:MAG: HAMP domain-containing protein [Nitrospirae bacterium]|nr:HAMP domain-containing protein [Nitrospirota bacterium]